MLSIRHLLKNLFIFPPCLQRNVGFIRPPSRPLKTSNSGIYSLEKISIQLQTKQIESKVFAKNAKEIFYSIYTKLPHKSPLKNIKINKLLEILIPSLQIVSNAEFTEVFKLIEICLKECDSPKRHLENCFNVLFLLAEQKTIDHDVLEYCTNTLYQYLKEKKRVKSLNLYIKLISSKYHENFDLGQNMIMDSILFDPEIILKDHKDLFDLENLKFYDKELSPTLKRIQNLFQITSESSKQLFLDLLGEINEEKMNTNVKVDQINIGQTVKLNQIMQLINSMKLMSYSRLLVFAELTKFYSSNLISQETIEIEITNIFNKCDNSIDDQIHTLIELLPLFNLSKSGYLFQKLYIRILDYLEHNLHKLQNIDFGHLVYLLINANNGKNSLENKHLIIFAMCKTLSNRINSINEIIYVLPILLNYRVFPKELIEKLTLLDVSRQNFSNLHLIYYIFTYMSLYSKAPTYQKIIFNGFKKIDEELFPKLTKELSVNERCVLIWKTKDMTSHNKNTFLIKPFINRLSEIPDKWFASVVNNMVNSCYLMISSMEVILEIQKRWNTFNHKDLIYIGKAVVWMNYFHSDFWEQFMDTINEKFNKKWFENVHLVCDLYYVLFSLELHDSSFYKSLREKNENIQYVLLKKYYFKRPNLSTIEELNESELEIEQLFQEMGVKFQKQAFIGIHHVDFVIENKNILEVYGRHHFTERNILTASAFTREKQLESLGYKIMGVVLHDWKNLRSKQAKIDFLQKKLDIQGDVNLKLKSM